MKPKRDEDIEDCDILISASGSGTELAELASQILRIFEYHKMDYTQVYNTLREKVIICSGIPSTYYIDSNVLDTVIRERY